MTQQFTASMSALNQERNGSAIPLGSLLNNYVSKSPWFVENISPIILSQDLLVFKSWNNG